MIQKKIFGSRSNLRHYLGSVLLLMFLSALPLFADVTKDDSLNPHKNRRLTLKEKYEQRLTIEQKAYLHNLAEWSGFPESFLAALIAQESDFVPTARCKTASATYIGYGQLGAGARRQAIREIYDHVKTGYTTYAEYRNVASELLVPTASYSGMDLMVLYLMHARDKAVEYMVERKLLTSADPLTEYVALVPTQQVGITLFFYNQGSKGAVRHLCVCNTLEEFYQRTVKLWYVRDVLKKMGKYSFLDEDKPLQIAPDVYQQIWNGVQLGSEKRMVLTEYLLR